MDNMKNKRIYENWAHLYDRIFGSSFINKQRKMSINQLGLKKGDKILLIGVGTGEDLKFIPNEVSVTGVDITESMLEIARSKVLKLGFQEFHVLNMDGQDLEFEDNSFDAVILHLILSVVPDGNKCLKEAARVLKPNGKITVFDKFLDEDKAPSFIRKALNKITIKLGTDINRRFSELVNGISLRILNDRESILGGIYRIILLRKVK